AVVVGRVAVVAELGGGERAVPAALFRHRRAGAGHRRGATARAGVARLGAAQAGTTVVAVRIAVVAGFVTGDLRVPAHHRRVAGQTGVRANEVRQDVAGTV